MEKPMEDSWGLVVLLSACSAIRREMPQRSLGNVAEAGSKEEFPSMGSKWENGQIEQLQVNGVDLEFF